MSVVTADIYVVDCIYAQAIQKTIFHVYLLIVGTIHKKEKNI